MAENIKKLKYESGDKTTSSDKPMTCPSGHPITNSRGHYHCAICGWSSRQQVQGATPVQTDQVKVTGSKRDPRPSKVTVVSQRGIEQREKPRVIGG